MSYEKNTWANGDIVTSEKLNHMEDGIVGSAEILRVGVTQDVGTGKYTLDKTWQEIHDAAVSGLVFIVTSSETLAIMNPVITAMTYDVAGTGTVFDIYSINYSNSLVADMWQSNSADGYPELVTQY